MDLDRRILLSTRVWLTRWFHGLQLAAEQRDARDGYDVRVCESRGSSLLGLANCGRATYFANVISCGGDRQLSGPDHNLQSRTHADHSRLPMPATALRMNAHNKAPKPQNRFGWFCALCAFCAFWWV